MGLPTALLVKPLASCAVVAAAVGVAPKSAGGRAAVVGDGGDVSAGASSGDRIDEGVTSVTAVTAVLVAVAAAACPLLAKVAAWVLSAIALVGVVGPVSFVQPTHSAMCMQSSSGS